MMRSASLFGAMLAALAACAGIADVRAEQTVYDVEIVRTLPHDESAYTQGLFVHEGQIYESAGQYGASSLRRGDIESGDILEELEIERRYFAEGAAVLDGRIYQLTWREGTGFIYDLEGFAAGPIGEFAYAGEGWGLTTDGERLIMSDGSNALRFLDPETLDESGRVEVEYDGRAIQRLNELEYVDGEVFANIHHSDLIVRIDPGTGAVTGVIDARALRAALGRDGWSAEVLNGIAYDADEERLYLTGKYWPRLFEVRLVRRETEASAQ